LNDLPGVGGVFESWQAGVPLVVWSQDHCSCTIDDLFTGSYAPGIPLLTCLAALQGWTHRQHFLHDLFDFDGSRSTFSHESLGALSTKQNT
jgi:hypothetical protein